MVDLDKNFKYFMVYNSVFKNNYIANTIKEEEKIREFYGITDYLYISFNDKAKPLLKIYKVISYSQCTKIVESRNMAFKGFVIDRSKCFYELDEEKCIEINNRCHVLDDLIEKEIKIYNIEKKKNDIDQDFV